MTRAGPLLAATRLDQFRPLGALGEPAYLAHARLCAALEGLGAPDCARYFARPEPDRRGETISWHATAEGTVRAWGGLSEQELHSAAPTLMAIKQRLLEICAAREAPGAGDGFSRLVRNACVSPGAEHLFLVDGQPVLTAWGFEAERSRFDTLQFALPGAAGPTERPAAIASARDWSRLMRWWWAPLALLLGLALLWLLSRWFPDGRVEDGVGPSREVVADAEDLQAPPASSAPAAPSKPHAAPAAPPQAKPRSGEALSVPERGVDFLEGSWRTDSALVDRRDGKPLAQTFTFDRNGWGEVVTRRSDGVECRGRARAYRTAKEKLVIYGIEPAKCSDGDAFVPFRMECEAGRGGASECRGVNADDGSGYEVLVRRL